MIRLGVTGPSRAGKTVFITSLVANLIDLARMPQLGAVRQGRLLQAYLQPHPDTTVPRFDFEGHLAALTGDPPRWPESTRAISQLRLSLRLRPESRLRRLAGLRTVHLDIVDYPGEWLLDLPLMSLSFASWSAEALAAAREPARAPLAAAWLSQLAATDPAAPLDEPAAQRLADAFRDYLRAANRAGLSHLAPGRYLMPGDHEGSPMLTFCPLPRTEGARRGSLWRAFERRYDAYRRNLVEPFFRNHFARLHRQVVLIDVLDALARGPRAVADLRRAMTAILACFRAGQNGLFAFLTGARIERLLFCATKADHLHHSQHDRLAAIARALVAEAEQGARFRGAETAAMAVASLRATVEQELPHGGARIGMVRGRLPDGREVALHPGDLPEDPAAVLGASRAGLAQWPEGDYHSVEFAPPMLAVRHGRGLPHIRLDRALEFLIGDRL
ncbi:MAG: hypothetical protein KatS3mg118_0474 [Paracoccaceae bacterium]|nr:MAG: hypothetical protein KatS3mg118_0474 [Paracoccaceae bacterium]